MQIYLARHGQTQWNVEARWQGSTDIPLDAEGLLQAELLAKRLAMHPIHAIYSSPLKRAAVTAQAAAKKLGLDIAYRDDLKEMCLGEWEGSSFYEIRKKYPAEFAKWESDIDAQIGMGIESNFKVQERAVAALMEICETEKNDTLIVSHGGLINRLMCYLLHIPIQKRQCFRIQNTGLCIIECVFTDEDPRFQVVTLNDFSHLQKNQEGADKAGLALTTF